MTWIQKHFRKIIYISFLIPILLVAFVSISHVTTWYGLSNPTVWAIYLSVGIEVAALSALAAISAQMGRKVYVPFGIVTIIQFIGNIFFAYQYININSEEFKDWVDLVDPVVSYLGVESGNIVGHKRFLALFSGGMLPIISLSFLHMLVKFEEEDKKNKVVDNGIPEEYDVEKLSTLIGIEESKVDDSRITPSEEDIRLLEEHLRILNEKKFEGIQTSEPEPSETQIPLENLDISVQTENSTKETDETISEDTIINHVEVEPDETKITVEPDFYVEDVPQYSIDEENVPNQTKRLSYFRSH